MINKIFLIILLLIVNPVLGFPIPKDGKVGFDIIRKNKTIGSVVSTFDKNENILKIRTIMNIKVNLLFFPAYRFFQDTTETWIENEFVQIDGYTDFEDEREYYIKGIDKNKKFIASGMDGDLLLNKEILPLNYWNKKILLQKEVFDTQKGIVRQIKVQKLENEIIKINNQEIEVEKYILNASKNPKDKGPFPQYTLWYNNDELIKFEFLPPKHKKKILIIRNDWNK